MFKRRHRYLVLAAVVAIGMMLRSSKESESKINRENYEKIQGGMTRADVEELFGCPPGRYNTRPFSLICRGVSQTTHYWVSDEAIIRVTFHREDEDILGGPLGVCGTDYRPVPRESFAHRLRRLIPWEL
jgi:hypothetical protein